MSRLALTVAACSAAIVTVAAIAELEREPPQRLPAIAPKGDFDRPAFRERWATLTPPIAAPAPTDEPTEAIAPPVSPSPAIAPTHLAAAQARPVRLEICAAHGLRREYYRRKGWTYWRCVH